MVLVEPALDDPEVAGVRLEQEVERVAEQGDEADGGVERDIAGHPRNLEFRHSEIAGFPDQPCPHRRGDDVADHGHQADDEVHAEAVIGARHCEGALEQTFHRLDPAAHRGGVATGRQLAGDALVICLVHHLLKTRERSGFPPGAARRDWAGSR